MDVIETTLGTGSRRKPGLVLRLLVAIIPAANPDFEHFYEKVRKWWIEIDSEVAHSANSGSTNRAMSS